jgi:HSP20 family protein
MRPTSHWQPFQPLWNRLQHFQGEMNRLFDRWSGDGGVMAFPAVNVWEEADQVFVEAELPGLALPDLEIYVTGGNQLTLKGERKALPMDKGVWHRRERGFGNFVRILTLPFPVDTDKVEARLENGVLRVRLAKHESARARKVPVKAE